MAATAQALLEVGSNCHRCGGYLDGNPESSGTTTCICGDNAEFEQLPTDLPSLTEVPPVRPATQQEWICPDCDSTSQKAGRCSCGTYRRRRV